MTSGTLCPQLSTVTNETLFITKDNVGELITSTDERTPGTSVTVGCNPGFTLTGDNQFSCRSDGTWSYSSEPSCSVDTVTAAPSQGSGRSIEDDTKILIGVVAAVAGLIIIILTIMICTIWYRDRKRRRDRRVLIENFDRKPPPRRPYVYETNYGRRPGPSPMEMDEQQHGPSQPYRYMYYNGEGGYRALPTLHLCCPKSVLSAPMYMPPDRRNEPRPGYSDYYDDIKRSRRVDNDNYSDPGKHKYVSTWVTRSSMGEANEYDKALVHSRRDPFLWRNA
ncbi:uncharacterized protein LOC128222861 isoform X2 [Mya arenaria]|uniref:uncharacterized protein LOC128222861 isoform X2 n=1 Tax=Mya arenaria TaxID=6604 RepID=UPI0022E7ECBF|nr:uncharacterized protein LOC128222861 isoform X2 [Mya arenaria]